MAGGDSSFKNAIIEEMGDGRPGSGIASDEKDEPDAKGLMFTGFGH